MYTTTTITMCITTLIKVRKKGFTHYCLEPQKTIQTVIINQLEGAGSAQTLGANRTS